MKKALALYLLVVTILFSISTLVQGETISKSDTLEDHFAVTLESSLSIVPDISIQEVGTLKVTITWETPMLSFKKDKKEISGGAIVSYYALQANKEVVFTVSNQSIKSSNTDFSGHIKVKPDYTWIKASEANNVSITLPKQGESVEVPFGEINTDIKLIYAINTVATDGLLDSNLSKAAIADIMTAKVTFTIQKK